MEKNRKQRIIVSLILLLVSLAVGALLVMSGQAVNLENFKDNFSYNILILVGSVGDAILFIWSLNGLMLEEDKKYTKEELEKKIEPLKSKRKADPLAYAPGKELAEWRKKNKSYTNFLP